MRKILVPIDGSGSSIMAEETAVIVAKKTGASVTVLHVMQEMRLGYRLPRYLQDELLGSIQQHAEKIVNDSRALFGEEGVKVVAETVRGDPADSILKFLKKNPDLIVMGASGENEKDPYALGSVTRKVVMHTRRPTLLVKKVSSLSNLLVCVDSSNHSIKALKYAVELAQKTGAKITLINVQERRLHDASPKVAEELANRIISKSLNAIQKRKLKVDKKIEFGVPSNAIVEAAERGSHDVIVLGSRGLGIIERFLLGSVSDGVSQKAKSSVLIVPAKT